MAATLDSLDAKINTIQLTLVSMQTTLSGMSAYILAAANNSTETKLLIGSPNIDTTVLAEIQQLQEMIARLLRGSNVIYPMAMMLPSGRDSVLTLKAGDLLPVLAVQLVDANRRAVDINGSTVRFDMVDETGRYIIENAVPTIVSDTLGKLEYAWQVGDTDVAGAYRASFTVTLQDDVTVYTVPNSGTISIVIEPTIIEIANAMKAAEEVL